MGLNKPKQTLEKPTSSLAQKPKPNRPNSLYIVAAFIGVVVILVLGIFVGMALKGDPVVNSAAALLPTVAVTATPIPDTVSVRSTLPSAWTPTYTLEPTFTPSITPTRPRPTATATIQENTLPPPGNNQGLVEPIPPVSQASEVTGQRVIIDVDSLPLRVWPDESFQTIEYAVRGAVRTILVESGANDEHGNTKTWWYVADGYGWIPAEIHGEPTTIDYTPEALDEMIAGMDQRFRDDRTNYMLHLQRGWMLYSQQDYGSAISEITVAIEMSKSANTEDALLYEYRGKVYLDMKDYTNALRNFDQAIALGLEEASTYNRRGIAYKGLGRFDEALRDYETAVQLNPQYGLLYSNIGALIADQNKLDPAQLEWYSKAIQADVMYPYSYSNRANYYRIGGDYGDHVINDYTVALSYVPEDVNILNNRGIVYSKRGENLLARTDFNRLIQIDPTFVNGFINRGIDYWSTGDQQQAIDDLLNALRIDPNSDSVYYNLGTMLFQARQYEAAIYCYNRALEINPDRRDAQINRAQLYEMLGGLDETEIMAYASVELLITPIP